MASLIDMNLPSRRRAASPHPDENQIPKKSKSSNLQAMEHAQQAESKHYKMNPLEFKNQIIPLKQLGICLHGAAPARLSEISKKLSELGDSNPRIKYLNLAIGGSEEDLKVDCLTKCGFKELLRICQPVQFSGTFPTKHFSKLEKLELAYVEDENGLEVETIPLGFLKKLLTAAPKLKSLFIASTSAAKQLKECSKVVGSIEALYINSEYVKNLDKFKSLTYFDTTIETSDKTNADEMIRVLLLLPTPPKLTVLKLEFRNQIPSQANLTWLANCTRLTKLKRLIITRRDYSSASKREKVQIKALSSFDWFKLRPNVTIHIKEEAEPELDPSLDESDDEAGADENGNGNGAGNGDGEQEQDNDDDDDDDDDDQW